MAEKKVQGIDWKAVKDEFPPTGKWILTLNANCGWPNIQTDALRPGCGVKRDPSLFYWDSLRNFDEVTHWAETSGLLPKNRGFMASPDEVLCVLALRKNNVDIKKLMEDLKLSPPGGRQGDTKPFGRKESERITLTADLKIIDTHFSVHTKKALRNMQIQTVADLLKLKEEDVIRIGGRKSLTEIYRVLSQNGMQLAGS